MKKILLSLIFAALCFSAEVKDMAGNEVKIPNKVEKIAALWHANNQILLALGGADKIVATTDQISKNKWFKRVYPKLTTIAPILNGNEINLEELTKIAPDVTIVSSKSMFETLNKQGFITINALFKNYDDMKKSILLSAEIIGGNANKKANELISYIEQNIKKINKGLTNLSPNDRPKVLHIAAGNDLLKVDGKKSIIDEWIQLAGGQNAIQDKEGTLFVITAEEVAIADPDVIIVGGSNGEASIEKIYQSPIFAGTKAVKNKKVYSNPKGVFGWDRYGAEGALQILWAAKTLHPKIFSHIDLAKETKWFYENFMNYNLSDMEFNYILKGLSPEGE